VPEGLGVLTHWNDAKHQRVEGCLNSFVSGLVAAAYAIKKGREDEERRRREREEEERRRAEREPSNVTAPANDLLPRNGPPGEALLAGLAGGATLLRNPRGSRSGNLAHWQGKRERLVL